MYSKNINELRESVKLAFRYILIIYLLYMTQVTLDIKFITDVVNVEQGDTILQFLYGFIFGALTLVLKFHFETKVADNIENSENEEKNKPNYIKEWIKLGFRYSLILYLVYLSSEVTSLVFIKEISAIGDVSNLLKTIQGSVFGTLTLVLKFHFETKVSDT